MACDICGKTGTSLNDLLDGYKTDEIKAICPECETTINKQLGKIRDVTHNIMRTLLKRFMRRLKERSA